MYDSYKMYICFKIHRGAVCLFGRIYLHRECLQEHIRKEEDPGRILGQAGGERIFF